MPSFPKKDFTTFFVGANPRAVDVLDRLLVMDPDRRASAAELLAHPYFANFADPDDEVGVVNDIIANPNMPIICSMSSITYLYIP